MLLSVFLIGVISLILPQEIERPALPASLASDAHAVDLYDNCFQGDAASRQASAEEFLTVLARVSDDTRLSFLVLLAGYDCLPVALDAAFRDLSHDYLRASSDIQSLVQTSTSLVDHARFRGILLSAGYLELADPATIEALGRLLAHPDVSSAAREALRMLTLQEFANAQEFGEWWATHAQLNRSSWILAALKAANKREINLWRLRLQSNAAEDVLAAISESTMEVRKLGYLAMRGMAKPELPSDDSPEAVALHHAFEKEPFLELRLELLTLIPHFMSSEAAVDLLNRAMNRPDPTEQDEAARALQLIEPKHMARQALVERLRLIYGGVHSQELRSDYRLLLMSSLEAVGPGPEQPQSAISALLMNALANELNQKVRTKVYAVAGIFGGAEFRETLLPHLLPESHNERDRSAALDALVRIALDAGEPDSLLVQLHVMLADPLEMLRYRALKGIQQLKTPACLALIPPRLSFEEATALRGEMLSILSTASADGALEALLALSPSKSEREVWDASLLMQVGQDYEELELALAALQSASEWHSALKLADGFLKEGLSEEQLVAINLHHTRLQAQWLIHDGIADERKADAAEDSLGRLLQAAELEPAESEWPMLAGKLYFLQSRPEKAFAAFQSALASNLPLPERWPIALLALEAALQSGDREGGLGLAITMGEPPAEFLDFYNQLRSSLESLDPTQ